MQSSFRHIFAATAGAVVLVLTPAAMAASPYHPAGNEAGVTYQPDHASNKSRGQVAGELVAAINHPAWNTVSRGAPWPVVKSAAGLTRVQVNAELQTAMRDPAWDRASRGEGTWISQSPVLAPSRPAVR